MTPPPQLEISSEELNALIKRIQDRKLLDSDYETLESMGATLDYLNQMMDQKNTSIKRLLKLIFGASTEKTKNVTGNSSRKKEADKSSKGQKKKKGHGRNGAEDYVGAKKVTISHNELKHKDPCPECPKGKVYIEKKPKTIIRVTGQSPIAATIYEMEKLRCNLCGTIFTADTPENIGKEKYDATSGAMIALLKYGSGFPFYRLENLQNNLGIPLPSSTQWDIVRDFYLSIYPAYEELLKKGANGEVLHNDDTTMKILSLIKECQSSDRKGMFTTGIVSVSSDLKIALFYTGRNHAGENLKDLLLKREKNLPPPIQMCDALSRNYPSEFETIIANCLGHSRRKFVEVYDNFPDECTYILDTLGEVYKNDADTKNQKLTPNDRLEYHIKKSGPIMSDLKKWLQEKMDGNSVEPNSGLGVAIKYMLKHWPELTLFLKEPGCPIDNNICERALKKAILNRKNAMFYKTQQGARVGDLFMSLIYTCELSKINPIDYLVALRKNAIHVKENPKTWMPWNYKLNIIGSQA